MRITWVLDPSTLPMADTTTPTFGTGMVKPSGLTKQGCGTLYFINKSNTVVYIAFEDGSVSELPAWWARPYVPPTKTDQIWLSTGNQLAASVNPISQLTMETFQAGEDASGLYSGPINYRTAVGNQAGNAQGLDAVLTSSLSLNSALGDTGTVALTPSYLNLSGVSAQNPGYLVLGDLLLTNGHISIKDTRGNREWIYATDTITVPHGASDQTFDTSLPGPANWLTGVQIGSFSAANVTVTDLLVKRVSEPNTSYVSIKNWLGALQNTSPVTIVAPPGVDGFANFLGNGGISVRVVASNSNGSDETFVLNMYGYQLAFDQNLIAVGYNDWDGNNYSLGTLEIDGRAPLVVRMPLNFVVPIPITDPTQTDFGTMSYEVVNSDIYYNSAFTLDTVILAGVSFLALD